MKRRTSNTIASVLAVAALGIPALPILAQGTLEQGVQVEINTVQDFLNEYLSTKIVTYDVYGQMNVTYNPITFVDDSNYLMVLTAKNFYDSLSFNVEYVVNGNYYVPKSDEKMASDARLKTEIDAYFYANNDYFTILVNDAMAKDAQIKEAEALAAQAELEAQAQQTVESTPSTEVESASEDETTVENTDSYVLEDVQADDYVITTEDNEVEEELEMPISEAANMAIQAENASSLIEEVELVQPEIIEESITEEAQASVEVEMEEPLTIEQAAIMPIETIEQENSVSTTAQDFVKTYFTSSAGNIYTQANSVNYTTILNSLSAWNALSQDDKDQVNSILQNAVGKNYQTLLQEAQNIKYNGGTNSTYVSTGVNTNAGIYAVLCGISAAVFGLISKRKETTLG